MSFKIINNFYPTIQLLHFDFSYFLNLFNCHFIFVEDPIIVLQTPFIYIKWGCFYIFSTQRHGTRVQGSGKYSSVNLFTVSFLWKNEISPTHRRNLKYDAGNKIRLQYPVKSSNTKCLSLLRASSNLIGSVTGESEFSTANHLLEIR